MSGRKRDADKRDREYWDRLARTLATVPGLDRPAGQRPCWMHPGKSVEHPATPGFLVCTVCHPGPYPSSVSG